MIYYMSIIPFKAVIFTASRKEKKWVHNKDKLSNWLKFLRGNDCYALRLLIGKEQMSITMLYQFIEILIGYSISENIYCKCVESNETINRKKTVLITFRSSSGYNKETNCVVYHKIYRRMLFIVHWNLVFSIFFFFWNSLSSIWTSARESFMKIRSGQKTLTELNCWIIPSSTVHRSVVYDILKTLLSGTKGTHLKTYSIQCLYDRVPTFHTCCFKIYQARVKHILDRVFSAF